VVIGARSAFGSQSCELSSALPADQQRKVVRRRGS
jgi:hypothetical protein